MCHTEEVEYVTQNSPSRGSSVDDEGDGLKGGGCLAQHDGGDRKVHDDVHSRLHGVPHDVQDEVDQVGHHHEGNLPIEAMMGYKTVYEIHHSEDGGRD